MLHLDIQHIIGDLNLQANITIPSHGVTALFGRSGAGKSTLINLIAGLETAQQGRITLNDNVLFDSQHNINLPPEQRNIGYVFQEPHLFPHYRIKGNLRYGIKRNPDPDEFDQIVELLGINHLLERYPASLSGGEKQRVAIGRALLSSPDILLMDEPLSALDLPRKQELLDYLSQLAQQLAIPILYVSHSLDEIIRLADQLILLDQGKIIAYDKTERVWYNDVFQPWQPHSQKISLLELPIYMHHPLYKMSALILGTQHLWINHSPRYQIGDKMRITLASRDISLAREKPNQSSIRNILHGHITHIDKKQDRVDIEVNVENYSIWSTISLWAFNELNLQLNQTIFLQIKSVSI